MLCNDLAGGTPCSSSLLGLTSARLRRKQLAQLVECSMSNRPISALQQSSTANRSSTSLITPALTSLSDPPTKQVDAHLLEFLTAEVSSDAHL